jgi:hypothetical protein
MSRKTDGRLIAQPSSPSNWGQKQAGIALGEDGADTIRTRRRDHRQSQPIIALTLKQAHLQGILALR